MNDSKIDYKDMKDLCEILRMFERDEYVKLTGHDLKKHDIWIPYDPNLRPYPELGMEERLYYARLIRAASGQDSHGFSDDPDIRDNIHKFFCDFYTHIKKIFRTIMEELETYPGPEFELPNFLPSPSQSLITISYIRNGEYMAVVSGTKVPISKGLSLGKVEDLISDSYISGKLSKVLEARLEELKEDVMIFLHEPDKANELRGKILNFILTSDLILE